MHNSSLLNESSRENSETNDGSIENECNMKNVSPYMSKDMIAAAGFNVETPIVNAVIGNLSGTLPKKKNETEIVKCEICDCELSSNNILSFHINGSKHQKRLKAREIIEHLKEAKDKGVHLGNGDNPNIFKCEICSLTVNSAQQLEIHLSGAKHKRRVAKVNIMDPENSSFSKNVETNENTEDPGPSVGKKKRKEEPKILTCDICNVFLNSQTQFDQHLLSKKHFSKTKVYLHDRQIPGRGKLIKLLQFKSGETQSSMSNLNSFYHNESSSQFDPETYKRLFPYSNFITKSTYNKRINPNSLTQSSRIYQNRF